MKYKVSVITVCYNDAEGLNRTIKSVLSQNYDSFEYIIVDGGSTDGTLDVIKKNAQFIEKWLSEPDNGIYDAMNKGIKLASGEWLIMMNAGDIFSDENVLKNVFNYPIPKHISFIYSDVYGLRRNGERIVRTMSFQKGILIHQAILYRRSLHDIHGLYIVTKQLIVSDYLFFIRIPEEQVMKIDTIISVYEGGGVSSIGNWGLQQSYCADVVFRRKTFWGMVGNYCWKRIKAILPVELKDNIKIFCGVKDHF